MGSWLIIFLTFSFLISSMAYGSNNYDLEALDNYLFEIYANQTLSQHRTLTGTVYNISLPSNFSGMQVQGVRLRSGTFWTRGANISSFHIPPRVITKPYSKRIAILYENLGNWSSYYYEVRNYSLVAPVIRLTVLDSSNISEVSNMVLNLTAMGNPISISFPDFVLQDKNMTPKCVKFGYNMSVQFSNMTEPNVCLTQGSGYFSIVVPTPPAPPPPKKEEKSGKWWVVGFVAGFGGLFLLILVGFTVFKIITNKKMRKMEKEAEKGEAFDTRWIGKSKMPSASVIRTQPALEHEFVP